MDSHVHKFMDVDAIHPREHGGLANLPGYSRIIGPMTMESGVGDYDCTKLCTTHQGQQAKHRTGHIHPYTQAHTALSEPNMI